MYEKYKNVNLNKRQQSNELVHTTGQRVSRKASRLSLKQRVGKFVAFSWDLRAGPM